MGFVKYMEDGQWKKIYVPTDIDDTVLRAITQLEQRATNIEAELDNINAYIGLYNSKDGE